MAANIAPKFLRSSPDAAQVYGVFGFYPSATQLVPSSTVSSFAALSATIKKYQVVVLSNTGGDDLFITFGVDATVTAAPTTGNCGMWLGGKGSIAIRLEDSITHIALISTGNSPALLIQGAS